MPDELIENPVINSPYSEPARHFVFAEQGITNRVAEGRRPSMHLIPIPAPRKRGPQLVLEDMPLQERRPNELINRIREHVALWRAQGYPGVTAVTRSLIDHWRDPTRDRRLFFCQVEAAETAIYLVEVATRQSVGWLGELQATNREYSDVLRRHAFKIATGGGKTVVMAMLIAWQALNKLANSRDPRFAAAFLIVAPSITIRDRLRVLLPSDPEAAYRRMDLVPRLQQETLNRATILVVNFHHFIRRDRAEAARLTKQILAADGKTSPFLETSDEMAARVCRDIPSRQRDWGIVVINDEAHHCYRRKSHDAVDEELTAEERRDAKRDEEEAAVWISGLEAIAGKYGVKAVFDLSATPFFLKGSGHPEGTLFPWVVSDFALIDAIEAGIVKIPRVPVADNRDEGALPTYRNLWKLVGTQLPKGTRRSAASGADGASGEPRLPAHLEGALHSLYSNYRQSYEAWRDTAIGVPPVFIAVCNNTVVSKLVYDYVAGYERTQPNGDTVLVSGALDLFSNVVDGRPLPRPNTILIDSRELESGEPLSADFKKAAAAEIERYKDEYRRRFPGRDVEDLDDADILREVMNTVGKPGRLGEAVRCVVSVSMLTEGWDANTVTHVLGVRAFTTQLLCEQVVGRALRRYSYVADDDGMFPAEYAEVYGVPFSFIPTAATTTRPKVQVIPTTVRALDERDALAISFPRIVGYRRTAVPERLVPRFTADSVMRLTTREVPTKTELDPIVGSGSVHDLGDLRGRRLQEVAFTVARRLHRDHFRDEDDNERVWLFPQLLDVSRQWLDECLKCTDETFPQLLLLHQLSVRAAERIARAIDQREGSAHLIAVPDPAQPTGSTRGLEFDTIKPVVTTTKSHVSHVVLDSNWESKMSQVLEDMPEVIAYVKNDRLGFEIPYTFDGRQASYRPDFIARVDDGRGPEDALNLLVEVTGERRDAKEAKAATAAALWVPAVNRLGMLGRWSYVEVDDPWAGGGPIREHIAAHALEAVHA
ncbi:MAG: BPTD_3080 family restriction endonuclease [Candidatus Dormibacteria bacterium]